MGDIIKIYGTDVTLPDKPDDSEIEDWGMPKEDQYWRKKSLPPMFKDLRYDSLGRIVLTEEQQNFCLSELKRIREGFWMFLNGVATYITGRHYYYLQYWTLENKKPPEYRDTSRRYFLYLEHWRKVYWCLGILRGKGRRTGATSESTSNSIYAVTTIKQSKCGILSKTGPDARKLYLYRVQFGFRHLPFFLQPTLANDKDNKSEMIFAVPLKKNQKASLIDEVEGLNSMIDYQTTGLNSYDQERLTWILADEGGKWPPDVPFSQFLSIISETLVEGVEKVGFGEFPSTVNEMTKKGGAEFKKAWDGATWVKEEFDEEDEENDKEFDEDSEETANRFVRYFCAAYDGLPGFVGKYGESIIEAPNEQQSLFLIAKYGEKKFKGQLRHGAKSYLLRKRRKLKGEKLEEEIRKYPFNEVEMFMAANIGCVFNSLKITDQRQRLADNPIVTRKLLFYRKQDAGQTIGWRDANKSDEIYWEIIALPPSGEENKYKYEGELRKPLRKTDGVIGVDGYSNEQGGRKYGSKACGMIYRKFDFSDPENTGMFIGWIYGRPSRKEILHDQILLCSEFYGYQAFWEQTADDYLTYYRQRGRIGYLGKFPMNSIDPVKRAKAERFFGFPISPFAMTKQLDCMISYIEDYCGQIYWDKLLEQCLVFEPTDRTKSDCVVSAMIALVSSLNITVKPSAPAQPLVTTYQNPLYGKNSLN
jgi:hypothetical protein